MKKNLFILAVAAFALASCSNDDTVAENVSFNESNAISFRTSVNGATRAVDQTVATLQANGKGFYVTAIYKNGANTSTYFDNVNYKWDGSTYYTSDNKYYWPDGGTLDFFAYAPNDAQAERDASDYKKFTVIPSTTIAEQVDLIYANTDGAAKAAYGAAGVPLNFRHAESKIVVKVKNNADNNMKFVITGWKIVNVDGTAVFTYNDAAKTTGDGDTNGNNSAQLLYGDWTGNSDAQTAAYSSPNITANNIIRKATSAYYLSTAGGTVNETATTPVTGLSTDTETPALNMILIPQQTTGATAYATNASNAKSTGSYIALKMQILNADDDVVIADATANDKWAIWPVDFDWVPGKKYTYTIDLAGGGYWEANQDDNADLDPILENAEIKFVNVTVDDWTAGTVSPDPLVAPTNP